MGKTHADKKTEKPKKTPLKKIKINNHGFYFIIVELLMLLGIFIMLQCFSQKIGIPFSDNIISSLGIASQIITALVVCVLQILGISFSIQNNTWCGIKLQDLIKIGVDKHFDFLWIAIISITLLVFSIITYCVNLFYLNIISMILSVIFCFYVLICEIPYLMMNDATLKQIISNRIIVYFNRGASGFDGNYLLESDFNKMIESIICQKNLKTVYDLYSRENEPEYNKSLLYILLDFQQNIAFNLEGIDNKQTLKNITDALLLSTNDAMCSSFDITEILGTKIKEYSYFLTRTMFRLMETEFSKKAIDTIASCVRWKTFDRTKKPIQHDLYVNCIIALVTITVKYNDFRLLEAIKKEYSLNYFLLDDKYTSTLIFAIISLFLYYLAEKEQDVTDELKNHIRQFIAEKRIEDNIQILSWNELFKKFGSTFIVDYLEFIETFKKNEYNIEQMYYSSFAHWVVLDENFANNCYLANLFNKESCYNDDYSVILKDLTNGKVNYYLDNFVKNNFKDRKFTPSDELKEIPQFYLGNIENFTSFKIEEDHFGRFITYYENLKKDELKAEAEKYANISNDSLIKKFRPLIDDVFKKEWKINILDEVSNGNKRYISFIFERSSDAINFDEALVGCLTKSVLYDIGKTVSFSAIKKSELNKEIGQILDNEFEGISKSAEYYSWNITDDDCREKYINKIKETEVITGHILSGTYFIKKNAYGVDFKIEEFTAKDLDEDQLYKQVDKYKRADGQYEYQGVFMQRDEVAKLIRDKYVIFTLIYSFKMHAQKKNIFKIIRDNK